MHSDLGQPAWHDRCLICGSRDLVALRRYHVAHLVRCGGCSVTFAGQRASDLQLSDHYAHYGTAWHDSPITRARYGELLESFESYRRSNRVLDVGCGAGFFLEEAQRRGWDVYGTEFSARALKLTSAKGFAVVDARESVDAFEPGFFDVITAFEVFEHVRDPLHEAGVIAGILRRGGLLYCTTPNFNSVSRRLLGPRWPVIEYPEHLYYFTRSTLSAWLGRAGFVPRHVVSTGFSLTGVQQGFVQEPTQPLGGESVDARLRAATESSLMLGRAKSAVNYLLSGLGAGDTLKGRFELVGSSF